MPATSTQAPEGMTEVTEAEFFARLKADPRDIMPSLAYSNSYSVWETKTHVVFGRTYPGWRNPQDPKAYFVRV